MFTKIDDSRIFSVKILGWKLTMIARDERPKRKTVHEIIDRETKSITLLDPKAPPEKCLISQKEWGQLSAAEKLHVEFSLKNLPANSAGCFREVAI